jgi:hypothetical protein
MGEKEAQGGESIARRSRRGKWRLGVKLLAGTPRPMGEKQAQRERASHRGHRGGRRLGEAASGDAAQVEAKLRLSRGLPLCPTR